MKKLIIFLFTMSFLIFIGFADKVYASDSYFYTSMKIQNGTTGSQSSSVTDGQTNYARLQFGYYDIANAFAPQSKWRIIADYCIDTQDSNDVWDFHHNVVSQVDLTMSNFKYELLNTTCPFTASNGEIWIGHILRFSIDLTLNYDPTSTGYVNIDFYKSDIANYWWSKFVDYDLLPSSEFVEIDNTQNIINNQNQNQAQTNQKLDDINDSLNDDSGVPQNDVSSRTTEWSSKLAGTGPVSNMVLMPITLLNGYISGFNSSCSPYNLGNLMGTDIILPCINISNYLGSTLWNVIDVLFSGFMIYAIGKKFVKIFNDFTNLRDNQMDELYGGGK